jgi:hypothetical protein
MPYQEQEQKPEQKQENIPPSAGAVAPTTTPTKPKRATQLPTDFYPNETGVKYARQRDVSLAAELGSFRNWHTAKGSTMKDWDAAWRTWCDKAAKFGRAGSPDGRPAFKTVGQERAEVAEVLTGKRQSQGPAQTQGRLIDGEAHHVAG